MPEPLNSLAISLTTMAIIAFGTFVWKQFLRSLVLNWIQQSPDFTGAWQATWPDGQDKLIIDRQAGKWLYGTWTLNFAAPKKYIFEGQYIGETIVGYCTPVHKGEISVCAIMLRVKDASTLEGKVLGLETDPKRRKVDDLFVASNKWGRVVG